MKNNIKVRDVRSPTIHHFWISRKWSTVYSFEFAQSYFRPSDIYWSNVLTERFSIPNKNQTKEDTSF